MGGATTCQSFFALSIWSDGHTILLVPGTAPGQQEDADVTTRATRPLRRDPPPTPGDEGREAPEPGPQHEDPQNDLEAHEGPRRGRPDGDHRVLHRRGGWQLHERRTSDVVRRQRGVPRAAPEGALQARPEAPRRLTVLLDNKYRRWYD